MDKIKDTPIRQGNWSPSTARSYRILLCCSNQIHCLLVLPGISIQMEGHWVESISTAVGSPGGGCMMLWDPKHPRIPGSITDDVFWCTRRFKNFLFWQNQWPPGRDWLMNPYIYIPLVCNNITFFTFSTMLAYIQQSWIISFNFSCWTDD